MKENNSVEIDHIGIAVKSISEGVQFWSHLGWATDPETEDVPLQKVKVAMLPVKNQAQIELLEPTDIESPIAKFLDKKGPGIHHICLRVKNIEQVCKKLSSAGVKMINPTPVPGAHGRKVAFVHPSSTGGVLVELSEKS